MTNQIINITEVNKYLKSFANISDDILVYFWGGSAKSV